MSDVEIRASPPFRVSRSILRSTVALTVLVCACVLVAGVASALVLHGARIGLSLHATPTEERVWFSYPTEVDQGIGAGESLFFTVVATNSKLVAWREYDNGRFLFKGSVPGQKDQQLIVQIPSRGATPHSWITIWVGGLKVPLKVWVG